MFFPSQVSNLGGEGLGEGESEEPPRRSAGEVLKKGALPPCILRAEKWPIWGFRQSIYITAGNFYSSDNGEKGVKRKKAGPFARKNGRKAPQRKKYLISGFGHLRCSALENSGSKSPQTRMKPEKNGTTSILSSLHGAGEGKAAAPQRADSPRGGAPLPASSLKTYHRYVFLTLRPSQGSIPRHSEKRKAATKAAFLF